MSVAVRWLDNNGGLHTEARARWIDEVGETARCSHGQSVVTVASHSSNATEAHRHGARAIGKEALLLALGEPPEAMKNSSGDAPERPLIDVPDEVRMNCSIRHAIALVRAVHPGSTDAAILLDL